MILWRIAIRNILATRMRTAIIASLTILGTALVVSGGSLLSSLEQSMARGVVGSIAGHFQVYSKDAPDKLDLFNPPTGTPDLGRIEGFPEVRKVLEALPLVRSVVPMGTDVALVFTGNILDVKLEEMRRALAQEDTARVTSIIGHVQSICATLLQQSGNLDVFSDLSTGEDATHRRDVLTRVVGPGYWDGFVEDPGERMEYLENQVAPLAMDEQMMFLRYLGADTAAFSGAFPLFDIVKGQKIPDGKRGFLFSDYIYEQQVKNPVARRLDFIFKQVSGGILIAEDRILTRMVQLNSRQVEPIRFQLDVEATKEVKQRLQDFLGSRQTDLDPLLEEFLDMNDANFLERYRFFYDVIAPRIVLYKVQLGDNLTIRTITRSGFATAVSVKVYGTYQFRGLEDSALAGVYNLMDVMTFRDLYGASTGEQREEISRLMEESGVEMVDRGRAEEELFGESAEVDAVPASAQGFDEFADLDMEAGGVRYTEEIFQRVYSRAEIDSGLVIQAAVVLQPGTDLEQARNAIEEVNRTHGLGLKILDWREASGLVGQFIQVVWIVLITAVLIIFLVALVIINNSMVMATLDRTQEIGTLRAIGAQRGYVLKMFLIESSVLGMGSGILGIGLGSLVIHILGVVGIPAWRTELYFLFSGPRLYPELGTGHLAMGFVLVFVVSLLSTLYPAWLATRIAPVRAMDKGD